MNSSRPILLAEDDRVDAMTLKRAVNELHVINKVVHKSDGAEALAWINDPNEEHPCLILLDLNMPRMNGIEFLREIKKDAFLKLIPVIVLTSSRAEQDRADSFGLGISGYMLKPVDYKQFMEIIRAIDLYWTLSEFPPLE